MLTRGCRVALILRTESNVLKEANNKHIGDLRGVVDVYSLNHYLVKRFHCCIHGGGR